MQGSRIEPCLRGYSDRYVAKCEEQVSTHAVIFIDGLGIIHTSIDAWGIILRDSHNSLNGKENVCDQSKDAVRRGEVGAAVGKFVVLDYDESGK